VSVWVWIGVVPLGGGAAIARLLLDGAISERAGRDFPFGTLTVNITGSFLLGLLSGLALSTDALLLAGTATLGSYTTFSTWMFESQRLAEDAEVGLAAINLVASVIVGVAAAALGHTIATHT
jgi:fluoride exporter